MMLKQILVPTDFSPTADKALDYAVCLAKKSGADITLLHACELMHSAFHDRKELIAEYNETLEKRAYEQLEAFKKSIEETERVTVSTQLYDGGVIDGIIKAASSSKAELIIMGTLGRTGLRNKILGSRAAELLTESKVPVVTIPYYYEWSEPKNILLALNDAAEELEVLQPVFDIAELFQSDVTAAVFSAAGEHGFEVLEHTRSIHSIQNKLQKMFNKTFVHTVHLGGRDFEEAIEEYIGANDINLLAMITHKRSNVLEQIFHRSVTRKMNYHTTVPLLSVHHHD